MITNLSSLLKTVDDHHQQLSQLVAQLKDWLTNVADDRNVIGTSVQNLSGLSAQLATLLDKPSPDAARMAVTRAVKRLADEMRRAA